MLCYAVLCYAMLYYAMLCYAMLYYTILCYAILYYAILCYAMLCYAMLCYTMLCYTMLCYTMMWFNFDIIWSYLNIPMFRCKSWSGTLRVLWTYGCNRRTYSWKQSQQDSVRLRWAEKGCGAFLPWQCYHAISPMLTLYSSCPWFLCALITQQYTKPLYATIQPSELH